MFEEREMCFSNSKLAQIYPQDFDHLIKKISFVFLVNLANRNPRLKFDLFRIKDRVKLIWIKYLKNSFDRLESLLGFVFHKQ
jgi:hypothetical protein